MVLRIALISPKGPLYRYRGGVFKKSLRYAPLTLPTLAALVPPDIDAEVRIIDEGIEEVDPNLEADLVGMTVITGCANRAYELSARFRDRNIPVVLGGPHITLIPEEPQQHADAIVVGYAEQSWPRLLRDFVAGNLAPRYDQGPDHSLVGLPMPRWDLVKAKNYITTSVFEATRGCHHTCDFCVVPSAWGRKPYQRPIDEVVHEIKSRKVKRLIFIDLNLISDRDYAMSLFAALVPLKLNWFGLSTSLLKNDLELLDLMAKSGCAGLLIGLESLSVEGLKKSRKGFNMLGASEDPELHYHELISMLHARKITLQGTFVSGLDHDTPESIVKTADFAVRAAIDLPRFAISTPFPGTALYRRLESEDRILTRNWDLYDGQHVVFQPAKMTVEALEQAHDAAWKRAYSYSSIIRRLAKSRTRLATGIFANLGYRYYAHRIRTHYNCDWFIGSEPRVRNAA